MDAMSSTEESGRVVTIGGHTEIQDGQRVVVIAAGDSGIGLELGEIDRVFDAF